MPGIKSGKRILNPTFCWRDILGLKYSQYDEKLIVIAAMDKFCASRYLSLTEFFHHEPDPMYSPLIQAITKKTIKAMADKEIPCSFGFSLKYYHILLARGIIQVPRVFDVLMIDEFQDSQPVVLEIFSLLPAHTKIAVGDSDQSINASFLHTTDAFSAISDHGITLQLTKSYRCSTELARRVELFGKTNFSKTFKFEGIDYQSETDKSHGFIAKTNASLIGKMIEYQLAHKKYKNVRNPKLIFNYLITLIHLKPGCEIHDSSLKFLLEDIAAYYASSQVQFQYESLLSYILSQHPDDRVLKGSIGLISKYGGKLIRETYNQALAYYKDKRLETNLWVTTSHSSKGLSFGTVEIGEDINQAVKEVLEIPTSERTQNDQETLMVGYVTATRARYNLINCKFL